jgi:integrase/recombinase XerD
MANIKTLLDLRRAKTDGTFNIIFRITDHKKVYTINSGVALEEHFWDEIKGHVGKIHPNAKLLNIKLSKHYFKIEQAVLSLDDEFSIEKLKAILSGKPIDETPETFQVFSNRIIQQMIEANRLGNAMVYQTAVNRLISYCGKDIAFPEISNLNNYFLRFRLILERNTTKWRLVKLFIVKILKFLLGTFPSEKK